MLDSQEHQLALSLGIPLTDLLAFEDLISSLDLSGALQEHQRVFFWLVLHLFSRMREGFLFSDLDNISQEILSWLDDENPNHHLIFQLFENLPPIIDTLYNIPEILGTKTTAQAPLILFQNQFLYLRHTFLLEEEFWLSFSQSHLLDPPTSTAIPQEVLSCLGTLSAQHKEALTLIHNSNLLIVTGGPGTGKTYTLSILLHSLILTMRQNRPQRPPVIVLAAPTGRAQARMSESIHQNLAGVSLPEIPKQGITLHKLLGDYPGSLESRPCTPIFADIIAVDESSMIDIRLFTKLVQSIPKNCKLILLGDPQQLPSVELGAVFSDMMGTLISPKHLLAPFSVKLEQFHRAESAQILALAQAAIEGNRDVFSQFEVPFDASIPFCGDMQAPIQFYKLENTTAKRLLSWLRNLYKIGDKNIHYTFQDKTELGNKSGLTQLFALFESTCVLCARRERHPLSVEEINQALHKEQSSQAFFAGQPIIVKRNLPEYDLSNGERGLVIQIASQLFCCFVRKSQQEWAVFPLGLLRENIQTCYAMTIHKSQGSEFEHVCIILPDHSESLMNRSLLFTAITRAKKYISLFSSDASLSESLQDKFVATTALGYRCTGVFPEKKIPAPGQLFP